MKKIVCFITTLLLITCFLVPLDARAGGGGGGGSSTSESGGGGDTGPIYSSGSGGTMHPIATTIILSIALFGHRILSAGLKVKRDYQNQKYARRDLKESKVSDFDEKTLKASTSNLYFEVQKAWSNQDLKSLENYLTPSLYEKWLRKFDWMDYRGERNILSQVRLYKIFVVEVDCSEECFIVAVYGRMKDKTLNSDNRTIDVNRRPFIEYWKIIKLDNQFYLDEVYQEDEY